jgi:hypothetical protein
VGAPLRLVPLESPAATTQRPDDDSIATRCVHGTLAAVVSSGLLHVGERWLDLVALSEEQRGRVDALLAELAR